MPYIGRVSVMRDVILFDFDGPLVDSFRKHIDFCLRMAKKYELLRPLPEISDLAGWRIIADFPMVNFLKHIGFAPPEAIRIHDNEYLEEFGNQRTPPFYPGVREMIERLKVQGSRLGIISLNNRINIMSALGPMADCFDIILSADEFSTKPPALNLACSLLSVNPERAVYIGDAPHDFDAACAVKMPFIGVSYGWIIDGTEENFKSAASPEELEWMLAFLEE